MQIYFIRHGHPNYKDDCLTDLGNLQAKACAKRLKNSGIQKIFSSPKGRAKETAEWTAKELGLAVEIVDFMSELNWGSKTAKPLLNKGEPWGVVSEMVCQGENLLDKNWAESEYFSDNKIVDSFKIATSGIDEWLRAFGYEREGDHYRVVGDDTKQTVAIFAHAAVYSAVLSHLLSVTFPWVVHVASPNFTSITVVTLRDGQGSLAYPRLSLLNDARHIENIEKDGSL